ncbi:REP-associated tyrosine transposase [Pseudoxanthomonas mexicana]
MTATTLARQSFFSELAPTCAAARRHLAPDVCRDSRLLAWVLMPDHGHWLVQVGDGDHLASIMNRIKSATARAYNEEARRTGALWARAYHERLLRGGDDVRAAARYLVANPVRAGLVERVGDYPFWDAVWIGDRNSRVV